MKKMFPTPIGREKKIRIKKYIRTSLNLDYKTLVLPLKI